MAKKKKSDSEENKKKRKGKKIVLKALLPIVIIIVLVASFFFAIINGIIDFIEGIINTLLELFADPLGLVSEMIRDLRNSLTSTYHPPDSKTSYMAVYINNDAIEQIKEGLAGISINSDKAGLTNSVLKSIILAYYSTYATVDTVIYTPINEDEAEEIINNNTVNTYSDIKDVMNIINGNFVYFKGTGDKFPEEDSQLYMATKGTVRLVNEDGEPLEYYDSDSFNLVQYEFNMAIGRESQEYVESFFDTFNTIYTASSQSLGSVIVIRGDTEDPEYELYAYPRALDYKDKIAKYGMPIELLIDMLDITASPEFIEETVKLVEGSSIEIAINQSKLTETRRYYVTYNLIDHNNNDEVVPGVSGFEDTSKQRSHTAVDYSMTLNSVDCWYCKGSFDTISDINEYEHEDDETATYDFEEFIQNNSKSTTGLNELKEDENGNISYSIINKGAISELKGKITSYSQSTATHEPEVQEFIELLKKKYKDIYTRDNETAVPGELLTNGAEALFQLLEQPTFNPDNNHNPSVSQYINVMKYILYMYSGIDFGVTDLNEAFELFDSTTRVGSNYTKVFDTKIENVDEFRDFVQEYGGAEQLSNLADLFYNICQQDKYNVNPCFAYAWACVETRNGYHIENNNLFGMAESLGSDQRKSYNTPQQSITDFCDWILDTSTEGTEAYNSACATVQEYAPDDKKLGGNPHNNIYVLFINFPYVETTPKEPEARVQTAITEINRKTQRTKTIFGDDSLLRSANSLVAAAWEVVEHYYPGHNIHYAGSSVPEATNNGRYVPSGVQNSWNLPLENPSKWGIVCATFVSLSIWKAGLIDEETISGCGMHGCYGVGGLLDRRDDWLKITNWNDLQDGDVVWTDGHIWIYLEGGYVLDQNYCAIRSNGNDNRGNLGDASWYVGSLVKAYRYIGR